MNIYHQSVIQYKTLAGLFNPRVSSTGVKQGDPLSRVPFIVVLGFLVRKIQKKGSSRDPSNRNIFHYILAYAGDVLILAKDPGTLQALRHKINNLATKIGLKFNRNKCMTMHYSKKFPVGCMDTTFNINGADIPYIRDGVPVVFLGAFLPKDTVTIDYLKKLALTIIQSKLGLWQRIDCLKTFYY